MITFINMTVKHNNC